MQLKLLMELYLTFAKIGSFAFGGGYTILPLLKAELVEKKKWLTEDEIIDAYALSQCLPGAIAVNTSVYIGNKKAGALGGVFAALGMATPSFIIIMLVSSLLNAFMQYTVVQYALAGVRAGVCALILTTVISLIKHNVKSKSSVLIFLATLLLTTFTSVSPIIPIAAAAILGMLIRPREGGVSA